MTGLIDLLDFTGGSGVAPKGMAPILSGAPVPVKQTGPTSLSPEVREKINKLVLVATSAFENGKSKKLRAALEEILTLDPKHGTALYNLAVIERDDDKRSEAETLFRRAIEANPENIDAYQGLGDLLFGAKHTLSAIKVYEKALLKAPHRIPVLINLLRSRIMMRQLREVETLCERILAISDIEVDVYCYLAWTCLKQGSKHEKAKTALDRALALGPNAINANVLLERWAVAQGDEQLAATIRSKLQGMVVAGTLDDLKKLTEFYLLADGYDVAAQMIQEYLQVYPTDADAEGLLLQTIMSDGDFVSAQVILDKMAARLPDHQNLRMSRCLNNFRLGNFDLASAEMDSRWGRKGAGDKWDLPVPNWDGAPIRDGKLAVYAEQGVGDHVMYGGQMLPLRDRCRHVVFEITSRQTSLFQRSFPDFEVVDRSNLPAGWRSNEVRAKVAAADLVPAMSLDYRDLPGREGFLIPSPEWLGKLRKKYQARHPGKLLVGISWRSGNRDSAAARSLELFNWLPILSIPNAAFVNLQYGDVSADVAEMRSQYGIEILVDNTINPMGNMDPFTAQVAAMDLVISVDNSTIHYAAALGKPVWAMLPVNSDWRWLTEGMKSVWYDSLDLHRQKRGDLWETLIDKMAAQLRDVDSAGLGAAHVAMLKRCAETLLRYGRLSEAEDYCRMLLELGEHKDIALRGIGLSALAVGRPDEAVGILARGVELATERGQLQADLAVALDAAGQTRQAEKLARDTVRQYPENEGALISLARVLASQNRLGEATDFYARVLRQKPDHIFSRIQLARLQAAQGEWGLARGNFEKALAFAPTSAIAHVGLAEANLRGGDYANGWPHWGWRFGTQPGLLPRHLETIDPKKYPKSWEGGHLRRTRVFLRAERSLAEQLLFAPLLAEAEEEARSLLVECEPTALPLLQAVFPKIKMVPAGFLTPQGLIDERAQIVSSLGDLAARYRADSSKFPHGAEALLKPDHNLVEQFLADYRAVMPGKKLIGLAWRGGEGGAKTVLQDWLPLFDLPELGIVSVQRDAKDDELNDFAAAGRDMIIDPRAKADLAAYLAQLASLDVVIAIDDVTAHLAALLGKSVIKVVSVIDHWCWGSDSNPQMWYDNLRAVFQGVDDTASELVAAVIATVRK